MDGSAQALDRLAVGTTADAAHPFSAELNAALFAARTAGRAGTATSASR